MKFFGNTILRLNIGFPEFHSNWRKFNFSTFLAFSGKMENPKMLKDNNEKVPLLTTHL